jgi:8-oxo-dGTP diphosphatase
MELTYWADGVLKSVILDGRELELFDVLTPEGVPSGVVRERSVVHRIGSYHHTVHMWITRNSEKGPEILLQKRSKNKDSNPGCFDISSAGHISSGDIPLLSAVREMKEELGINADTSDIKEIGLHRGKFSGNFGKNFHDRMFKDREISHVYIYDREIDIEKLELQESEVESVKWIDWAECRQALREKTIHSCIYIDEFEQLGEALGLMKT